MYIKYSMRNQVDYRILTNAKVRYNKPDVFFLDKNKRKV